MISVIQKKAVILQPISAFGRIVPGAKRIFYYSSRSVV